MNYFIGKFRYLHLSHNFRRKASTPFK